MTVDAHLDELEAAGMVGVATVNPELEYLFRHWLVHEAAYSSLLKQERRELHLLAGEVLEKLYPDRLGELAPQLAQHFEEGEDRERALEYLVRAGHYALDRTAYQESRRFFDRAAIYLAEKAGDDEASRRSRVDVALGRVKAGWAFTASDDNVAILEAGLAEAEALGDDALLLDLWVWIVLNRQTSGEQYDTSAALRNAIDRTSEIAGRTDDPGAQAMPLMLTGMSLVGAGQLRAGVEMMERAVPMLQERRMTIAASFALVNLAGAYAALGELDKGSAAAQRALDLAGDGDPIARVDARLAQAFVARARGNAEELLEISTECEERAEELGAYSCAVVSKFLKGTAHLGLDQAEQARTVLEASSALSQLTYKYLRPSVQAELGTAYTRLGDRDRARRTWDEAVSGATAWGDRPALAVAYLNRGMALADEAEPDWDSALRDLEGSVQLFDEMEATPDLVRALEALGAALIRAGRGDEAQTHLDRAQALKAPSR